MLISLKMQLLQYIPVGTSLNGRKELTNFPLRLRRVYRFCCFVKAVVLDAGTAVQSVSLTGDRETGGQIRSDSLRTSMYFFVFSKFLVSCELPANFI